MAETWDITFDHLVRTPNAAAGTVLEQALDSPVAEIRERAVAGLLRRPEQSGHFAVLRRIDPLDPAWPPRFEQMPLRFLQSLREALVSSEERLRENAYQVVLWCSLYDTIPLLVNLLERPEAEQAERAGEVLLELTRRLADSLAAPHQPPNVSGLQRAAEQARRALAIGFDRYGKHKRREVIEAYIPLIKENVGILREALASTVHPARNALLRIFREAADPSILQALCGFLQLKDIPTSVLGVLSQRDDPAFVRELLRQVGAEPPTKVRRNLKRLLQLKCLNNLSRILPELNESEQSLIPSLIIGTSIPTSQALPAVGEILRHGLPAARAAAAEALGHYHGAEANALAIQAAHDPDPLVVAAVLPQLRGRGLSGALPIILQSLESSHPLVRRAARRCLREFSFRRFLETWDMLPPDVRRDTGMLVKRVDGHTTGLLRAELASPFRSRRLRALSVVQELDLVSRVESSVLPLLQDEDPAIRAEAAAALALTDSPAGLQALRNALTDPNALVREAAENSIRSREERRIPSACEPSAREATLRPSPTLAGALTTEQPLARSAESPDPLS
ncbi:MAG: hypothetical protein GYA33_02975 [Thermogutta sp.]|nr:hypothetical protein [Thermogutta sp.]